MQIAHSLDQALTATPVVLTIGVFDGMHLGHQRLITTAIERANVLGVSSAVLTFGSHPDSLVRPDEPLQLLTSLDERIALIESFHPDFLVVAPFDRTTMSTPADEYMRRINATLPLSELWVGDDFALGRKREGDLPRLAEIGRSLGYTVGAVARVLVDGQPVSSTRVREALRAGEVDIATALLGREYSIQGDVVHGDQRGRTIGFPTANIALSEERIIPANGVYACFVDHKTIRYKAVTNIGTRPTFDGLRRTVEAYLLDFHGDLYDQTLRLSFVGRLRSEQRFTGIDALIAQIERDVIQARAILNGGDVSYA